MAREFGPFDLDPAAQPHTAKASRYFTPDEDGLSRPWFGRVWLNPPYSKPRPWCEKAREETTNGNAEIVVMLLPASVDTRWFHEAVLPYAELRFIRGRVRFVGWEGTPIPSPKAPSIVAIYRRTSRSDLRPSTGSQEPHAEVPPEVQ
jgi:phage N-6-adenine-methyltransferase